MKVNQNPNPAAQTTLTGTTQAGEKNRTTELKDKSGKIIPPGSSEVEISDDAKLMQKAGQIAKNSVVNSPEKIADLKKRIQDGTYSVEAGFIADKLIEEHFGAHLGKNSL